MRYWTVFCWQGKDVTYYCSFSSWSESFDIALLKAPTNAMTTATEVAFSKSFVFVVYLFSLLESSTFTSHHHLIY